MRVWDVATGECRRSWKAHRTPALCAAFEPSGTLVATGGSDRAVFVWDVDNGYATHSFRGLEAVVTVVAFLPHPHSVQRLAGGAENGSVRVWDLLTQQCVAVLAEHFSAVTSIAFSPDPHGYTMLTAGRDALINLWDTRDLDAAAASGGGAARKAEVRAQITTHEAVEALVVLPTAAAAAGSSGGTTAAAAGAAAGCSASGSDFLFFSAGEKGVLRKWRLQVAPGKDGKTASRRYIAGAVAARTVPQLRASSASAMGGGGSDAPGNGSGGEDGGDDDDGEGGAPAAADSASNVAAIASKAVAVSADAVPVGSQFEALLLRRVALAPPPGAGAAEASAAGAGPPAGAAPRAGSGSAKRKRPAAEAAMDDLQLQLPPHGGSSGPAPAAARHRYELLAVTRDQVLTLVTAGTLRHVRTTVGHSDEIVDVAYLPPPLPVPADAPQPGLALHAIHRKQLVAVATNSEQLRLMDVADFSTTLCDGHGGIVLAVSPSPDGTLVATASKDFTARVWDVATGACVAVCDGHTEAVTGVAWPTRAASFMHCVPVPLVGAAAAPAAGAKAAAPPVGGAVLGASGWLASVSKDRTVKLWQLGALLAALPSPRPAGWSRAHLRGVLRAVTAGAGAGGSGGGALDPLPALRPRTLAAAVAHDKDVNAVAVAPNDKLVATGGQDKLVKLWTAPELLPVATLRGHKRGVWGVAFSPADQLLASCSGDRTVRLWSVGRGSGYACLRTLEGHEASVLCARFLPGGTQLVSTGADGLLKLWGVSDGECVNTFAAHDDKAWAVAVRPPAPAAPAAAPAAAEGDDAVGVAAGGDAGAPAAAAAAAAGGAAGLGGGGELLTVGGDSVLAVWRDVTSAEAAADMAATEEAVVKQQELFSAMATRDYPGAIRLALELEQPGRAGDIMQELLEMGPRPALAGLSPAQLDEKTRGEMLAEVAAMAEEATAAATSTSAASASASAAAAAAAAAGEALLTAILRSRELLPPPAVGRLLGYIREWNTQSRHGMLAQRLLHLLLRALPRGRLLEGLAAARDAAGASRMVPGLGAVRVAARGGGRADGTAAPGSGSSSAAAAELRALVGALLPYSERHGERLDRLQLSSYLADYTLDAMRVLTPAGDGLGAAQAAAAAAQPRGGVAAVVADEEEEEEEEDEEGEGGGGAAAVGGGWAAAAARARSGRAGR
jgi:WD40 repeat protein